MYLKSEAFAKDIELKATMSIENMTLFSNPMTVAYRDKDYAAYSVETLLGQKVTEEMKREMVVTAENPLSGLDKRDARLDAVIEFPSRKIHIEIQNISREDDIPRSPFYLGGLLFDINKGVKVIPPYSLFSIWICNFNPLSKKGIPELPYYTFEQMYRKKEGIVGTEESFELEDGVTLIFINAQYDWDRLMEERELTDGERALMEYLNDMNQSHLKKIIHKEAFNVLSLYKEGGPMYDKLHEEYKHLHEKEISEYIKEGKEAGVAEGKVEGRAEGIDAEKIATAKRMLEMNLDLNIIAQATALDTKTIESLR